MVTSDCCQKWTTNKWKVVACSVNDVFFCITWIADWAHIASLRNICQNITLPSCYCNVILGNVMLGILAIHAYVTFSFICRAFLLNSFLNRLSSAKSSGSTSPPTRLWRTAFCHSSNMSPCCSSMDFLYKARTIWWTLCLLILSICL